MNDFNIMAVLNAAIRILAARLLTMLCLVMVFGLSCWAMVLQTTLASAIAAGFAVLVFLPVLHQDGRKGEST
jgi:hypothetical protein